MYHALWRDEADLASISAEDKSYAVHADDFEMQMRFVAENGFAERVTLTFDDGHDSALHIASPILQQYGLTATIFITGEWLDKRSGFCRRDDLLQLIRAGWTVGAHGQTHRFLTTLGATELDEEFALMTHTLQEFLGDKPALSFPGGRYGKRELAAAQRHGYVQIYNSRPARRKPAGDSVIPRYPVRGNTAMAEFESILCAYTVGRVSRLAAYHVKAAMKKALGDNGYQRLYRLLRG